MRTTLLVLTAGLAVFPLAAGAVDDKPPQLQPVPEIAPPPGVQDPDLEPKVTISRRGDDKVEEYRLHGRLYMIKVTPRHGKPYYLVDQRGDGLMRRYDDLSPNLVVPMWMIKEF
ncbi:DUF2782 domain-containing protein [Parasulfuritortus cantonensis]|uniref:DUF2782 domain-containing protein n=1 Tax=Parasulfuritortus cantonensis TaxID=2528202 RepID=A0A4R1BGI7_9PROT|nr:DUF2782 domain-containing protein [Parasulfuritortus cantonensis]TCJ16310.1 DUF2782 domain-containing protein [Parasulfuritortus cantonensis]